MRRRIVTSTAVIALASVIVLGVPLALVDAARVRSDATSRLEREADAVAAAIDDRLEARKPLSAVALARYVPRGHRVLISARNGVRLTVGSIASGDIRRVRSGVSREAAVVAEAPASESNTRVLHACLLIAGLGLVGVAAAVGLAFLQARRLARPLESLAETSAQLGSGDFSTRAGRFEIPEVDALAHVLDASAERIARLVAREREFSANVSHQLRTPLTALRLRLEELSLRPSDAEQRAELDAALSEMDRLEGTIGGLLEYARRATAGEAVDLDLSALARRHAAAWGVIFRRAGRTLDVDTNGPVPARASPGGIGQVLDVLLENALTHGDGPTTLAVSDDGRRGVISVEDSGAGVSPDAVDEIFERGASDSGGTGIGLHLAQVLATAEGGRLVLARRAPARFELVLPHRPE